MALILPADRAAPQTLGALWRVGLRGHIAGCSCGFSMPPIDPRDVELDLLDYLSARYERDGDAELAGIIETQRSRARDFEAWLDRIEALPLAPAKRERLATDLRTFVESLAGNQAGIGICF